MSIQHSQNLVCFCNVSSHSFSKRSGPGPVGPVWKILVVQSCPEGPQFARSIETLLPTPYRDNIVYERPPTKHKMRMLEGMAHDLSHSLNPWG